MLFAPPTNVRFSNRPVRSSAFGHCLPARGAIRLPSRQGVGEDVVDLAPRFGRIDDDFDRPSCRALRLPLTDRSVMERLRTARTQGPASRNERGQIGSPRNERPSAGTSKQRASSTKSRELETGTRRRLYRIAHLDEINDGTFRTSAMRAFTGRVAALAVFEKRRRVGLVPSVAEKWPPPRRHALTRLKRRTCMALLLCCILTKPPVNIVSGALVARRNKHPSGCTKLKELTEIHKRGEIGYAGRLLYVVGHDRDRAVVLELIDQFFDFRARDRVERRAGFVEQNDLRPYRQGAGDAKPLLLPKRKAQSVGGKLAPRRPDDRRHLIGIERQERPIRRGIGRTCCFSCGRVAFVRPSSFRHLERSRAWDSYNS